MIAPEVEHALETGAPVVALESAIITHGMPYPTNANTASTLESIIRSHGVTPATVAFLDGKVHVGLSAAQIDALADPNTPRDRPAVKVSRRDIAPALAGRRAGGTTVAGTMVAAHSVGITGFVTGGIGGVHRGAQSSESGLRPAERIRAKGWADGRHGCFCRLDRAGPDGEWQLEKGWAEVRSFVSYYLAAPHPRTPNSSWRGTDARSP